MSVYRTGSSTKCIIWCYDIYGFQGGRTRETCDKIADLGYMVIMPDFFRGEWRGVEAEDLHEWLHKHTDWRGQRQIEWVEQILPYARELGAEFRFSVWLEPAGVDIWWPVSLHMESLKQGWLFTRQLHILQRMFFRKNYMRSWTRSVVLNLY